MRKMLLLICSALALSCEGGLSPTPPPKPGFDGTILFANGTWPGTPQSPDSLWNLWVFASQNYPLDSSLVFSGLFSSPPTIFLYPSFVTNLAYYVDTLHYQFDVPPGLYKYVGVIQHVTPDYASIRSLRVVGFAVSPSDTSQPLQVQVTDGNRTSGIDIKVDFHHPPPQPF